MPFDPRAPLPDAPDPWAPSSMPELRDGPPYRMTEMIAAEPALAERVAGRVVAQEQAAILADRIRAAAAAREPIVTTGCGTSEHAAMAIAALLEEALGGGPASVPCVQAFELARRPPGAGVVLAVSHEGGTEATNAALRGAREAGAITALVTVSERSPAAELAELVVTTGEQDQSWCHTVGYTSPIVAGAAVAGLLSGRALDGAALRRLLEATGGASAAPAAEAAAASLAGHQRLLITGSGVDFVGGRELALKVEEGARIPAVAHELETIRHGHLAAHDEETGFVLLLTDGEGRGRRLLERARSVLAATRALRIPAVAILAEDLADAIGGELTPAGRLAVPVSPDVPRLPAALVGTALPLQLLAERLARARGLNPDPIGRDDPRQAAAAEA